MTEAAPGLERQARPAGRSRPPKTVAALLLCLSAVVCAVPGTAAEADARSNPQTTRSADQNKAGRDDSAARARSGSAPAPKPSAEEDGDFTPSEEISEDFAVSFPVDI